MAVIKEYEMKISVKDAKFNVEELNKSLDAQSDLVQELTDNVSDYERELDNLDKKDTNRIAQTKKLIEVTKRQLKEEKDGIKQIKTERTQANKVLKDATKNQADYSGVLGYVDKQLGGAISGIQGFTKGLMGATKGAQLLKIGLIATGLGAFVVLLGSLTAAFTRSEKGQEKMQILLAAIGAIVDVLLDNFAKLGEMIIKAVQDPIPAMKTFATKFQLFMLDPWGRLADAVKGAGDGMKKMKEEAENEMKTIKEATDARIKAHHIERDLLTERAQADRDISEIRLKAEDRVNSSATERIAMLRKAQKIEEEITSKEIAAKQLYIDAQAIEIANGDTTIEAKDKLAKLQGELIKLDTKKLRSQRLLQTQITTALNEEQAAKDAAKKIIDDEIAAEEKRIADEIELGKKTETKRLEDLIKLKAQIADAEAVTDEQRRALQIEKVTAHYDKLIELAKAQGLATDQLEKSKSAAINKASQDNSKNEIYWETLTQDQKAKVVSDGLNNLASVLGEETAAGKAAAIAAATIDTFQSATASYKSLAGIPVVGPALGAAAAGAAIASGFKQVQAIRATPVPTLAGKAPPSVNLGGAQTGSVPQLPSFNIVGASGTNQLADAIGSQTNQPVKTYVVASDVTTAQALERNIITGATVG